MTISNFGEAIEIQEGLTFVLRWQGGDAAAVIEDLRLADSETGTTLLGPTDPELIFAGIEPAADGRLRVREDAYLRFADKLVLETGQRLVLDLRADTGPALTNTTFFFELDMNSVEVEGLESNDTSFGGPSKTLHPQEHDIRPTGNITTQTYVLSVDGSEIGRDALRANDVEDIRVRSLN